MTKADKTAADRLLKAACAETVRQVRAGETTYICKLAAAVTAAELLLDRA